MDAAELRAELERHHQASFGWALSCCSHNRTEAEEALQTVYLKILDGRARFAGRASFKTWLFAVIRKTAAEERRRAAWRRVLLMRHGESLAATDGDCSGESSPSSEEFLRALARLPRRQREVLQLVFYHDLSIAEAAGVMKVSLGSARTHYERGKQKLRQWIQTNKIFHESESGRRENQKIVRSTERS